jgi:hypothetical protein
MPEGRGFTPLLGKEIDRAGTGLERVTSRHDGMRPGEKTDLPPECLG